MKKLKAILLLFATTIAIAGLGLFVSQSTYKGVLKGSYSMSPTGSSVGPLYEINVADGSGGWLDANCNVVPNVGPEVNCPAVTFTGRTVTNGSKTCPLFPDNWWGNTAVGGYPLDPTSANEIAPYASSGIAITGASWAAGVATFTVGSTAGIVNGNPYPISGVVSNTCAGGDCGYNSNVSSINGTGNYYTMTVVNGTTLTAPCCGPTSGNPGTYVSGGTIWNNISRISSTPAMTLNQATNATTVPSYAWGTSMIEGDGGTYPVLPTFQVEGYTFGGNHNIANGPYGGDNHVLVVNFDTCMLYEMSAFGSASPPYSVANGAIWNLYSNDLRINKKLFWYGNDANGVTSADVAGFPIWPLVLTYSELFSGQPIKHALRYTLNVAGGHYNGCVWPASHGCLFNGTGGPPLGSRWVLPASFDTTTCHFADCAGLPWPAYMQRLLVAMQTYGLVFSDGGFTGLITSDADQSWGDNSSPTSPFSVLQGYLHGIRYEQGQLVDVTQHVVSAFSGAMK